MTEHLPSAAARRGACARWRRVAAAAALCAASASAWPQAEPLLGSDLQGLLAHARTQNPELTVMRLEAEAAAQRIGPAGALPDPTLRVELMNIDNSERSSSPTLLPWKVGETQYTLMQMLPLWGKRGLKRDAAAADARQAGARAESAWVQLAARIKTAYAEYYRAVADERLAGEVLGLMTRLEQVAQARYAGGLAVQADVVRAQLERTAMQTELITIDNEKRKLRAMINGLLARDGNAPLAEPQRLRPLPAVTVADAQVLAERAWRRNPLVAAEAARIDAARHNRELAQRNRYPDLTVGVMPTQMGSRIASWGVMFEVNIPLQQGTRRAEQREAEAMVGAALARSQMLEHELQHDIAGNLAALDGARRTQSLLGGQLLPQSELALHSALAAYENGKAEFSMLLEAQRQIRKARQELLKAEVDAQLRLAEIERIVGEEL